MVTRLVIDDTEVDVGEELTGHISNFLMASVIVDGIAIELWIGLTELHIVDTDAVVSEGLSVHVSDSLANLEELLIGVYRQSELSEIVVEDTSGVVGAAFISGLACASTRESQNVVVFQTLLSGDSVIGVSVTHLKTSILSQHLLVEILGPNDEK